MRRAIFKHRRMKAIIDIGKPTFLGNKQLYHDQFLGFTRYMKIQVFLII